MKMFSTSWRYVGLKGAYFVGLIIMISYKSLDVITQIFSDTLDVIILISYESVDVITQISY